VLNPIRSGVRISIDIVRSMDVCCSTFQIKNLIKKLN
jgi:hypothetical protein